MSQSLSRPPEPNIFGEARPARATNLMTTAQYLVFEPGLYAIDIIAPHSAPSDMGFRLPSIRVEAVPATAMRPGRANIVSSAEAGWMWRGDEPVLVLVMGGRAGAVMTIYRADDGSPPPEIRVRHVQTSLRDGGDPNSPAPALAANGSMAPHVENPTMSADAAPGSGPEMAPLKVLAHISRVGDLSGVGGAWVGRPGAGHSVEGFTLTPTDEIASEDIEYQAILGNNWNTPWFHAGEFCGSRGLMLPLLGFRVRLLGAASDEYECTYSGHFLGGKVSGPIADGEACDAGDAPLEAMQISITRRSGVSAMPAAPAEPHAAKPAAIEKPPMPAPEATVTPARKSQRPPRPAAKPAVTQGKR
jgi:hypothetical protein